MTDNSVAPANEQSKDAKLKKREQNLAAMQQLLDAYPEIFNLKSPRPIKIGIHDEISTTEDLSKTKVRRGLASYVRQTAYLKSIVEGASRINIKGEADGVVTAEEASHAQEQLQQRFKHKKPARKPQAKTAPTTAKTKKPAALQRDTKKPANEQSSVSAEQRMSSKLEQLLASKGKEKQ